MTLTTGTKNGIRTSAKQYFSDNFLYFAVGDGTTAPTEGDTQLESETFRQARDSVDITTFPAEAIVTGDVGYTQNNGDTIAEIGWLDASSGGNLKQRNVLLSPIAKTNDIRAVFPNRATITVVQL